MPLGVVGLQEAPELDGEMAQHWGVFLQWSDHKSDAIPLLDSKLQGVQSMLLHHRESAHYVDCDGERVCGEERGGEVSEHATGSAWTFCHDRLRRISCSLPLACRVLAVSFPLMSPHLQETVGQEGKRVGTMKSSRHKSKRGSLHQQK